MDANLPENIDSPPPSRFHHVGCVVRSIAASAPRISKTLGLIWDGKVYLDPIQTVSVTFLGGGAPGDTLFELVEPSSADSGVAKFLARGGGLHHLCYEVESLTAWIEHIERHGGVMIQAPVPAVAFDGRKIAWVYTRDKLLVEFLESS